MQPVFTTSNILLTGQQENVAEARLDLRDKTEFH
jgi:hypothetical protein